MLKREGRAGRVVSAMAVALLAAACAGCAEPVVDHFDGWPLDATETAPTCGPGATFCNGVCTLLTADPQHCGACGTACAMGQACVAGHCAVVCPAGQMLCSGACVDPQSSPQHCGACGTACTAGQVCVAGQCAVTCPAGQVQCDSACIEPQSSPVHCGAILDCRGNNAGATCADGQACVAGHCTYACSPGQVVCMNACVDPMTSTRFCGAGAGCAGATACPSGQSCVAGACQLVCPPGQLLCDGQCVDPTSDRRYCGASADCASTHRGTLCPLNQLCVRSTCVQGEQLVSYIFPGGAGNQVRPRPTAYQIATAFPATIYYTINGSMPVPGAAGTIAFDTTAMNLPLQLSTLPNGITVHWYADFGAAIGRELETHAMMITVDPNVQHSHGEVTEAVHFDSTMSPIATVAPGAMVTGHADLEFWHSDAMGYCPSCAVQYELYLDGQGATQACAPNFTMWPGTVRGNTAFAFIAPMTRGRYSLHAAILLDFGCHPAGGEEVGVLFVQ